MAADVICVVTKESDLAGVKICTKYLSVCDSWVIQSFYPLYPRLPEPPYRNLDGVWKEGSNWQL